ncbi:MAG: transcriptional regulator NrdR [Kiritimatiellaeota bacterium]|nr:transcriptional regulator NrdR [Kiritimatiellota bacterium]
MKCSSCGADDDKVLESRSARDGTVIRRRRVCNQCGRRSTTYEEHRRDFLMVVKQNGSLEEFSRQKILDGVARACRKRPVTREQIEKFVDGVVDEIENDFEIEAPSGEIGARVMRGLLTFDQVAYVRFASVYKRYDDVGQFVNEVQNLLLPTARETNLF